MNEYFAFARSGLHSVAVRPAQLSQSIQGRAAHQHLRRLPGESVRRHSITKNCLQAKHRRLGQAASMISTLAFPGSPPHLPNPPKVLIPCPALGFGVPMLPNLGIALRRNRGLRMAGTDGLIAVAPVIAPIARHLPNRVLHLRRSEEHTSELQSRENLVCRLLLEKKKTASKKKKKINPKKVTNSHK